LETTKIQEHTGQNSSKRDFLTHIQEIDEIAKQAGGINDLFFEFARPQLELLSGYLHISQTAAALFAILICLYEGSEISINRLAKHLQINCIKVMRYMEELEILELKDLIQIRNNNGKFRPHFIGEKLSFELKFTTFDAFRKGCYHELFSVKNLPIEKFFVQLERLYEDLRRERQSCQNTIMKLNNLLVDNGHLLFVQKIHNLSLCSMDTLVLLRFFDYLVNKDELEINVDRFDNLFEHDSDYSQVKRQLRNGNFILLEKGLIENTCDDGFGNTDTFRLTDEVKDEFLVELDISLPNIPVKGLKRSDSINAKNMFYPEKTQRAIEELCSLLQVDHFLDVQKRLSENSMRTGFACLFSGSPGTGKTETALQIARITGRDTMQVDIASTKSKWFGESEKQIKAIFDKYRTCVKKSEITPILLFNEADAIFGKRRILNETREGPGQTENTIQNIILQEIENLNGILIATTNLSANMDTAFERRFLYKIEFDRPEAETRKAIWTSLIAGLSDEDAWTLASRFDFSGGQIENIARKSTVHRVLSGEAPILDDMIKFCTEEYLSKDKRIGFAT